MFAGCDMDGDKMSILKDKLKSVKDGTLTRFVGNSSSSRRSRKKGGSPVGSPEVLEKEAERFSQYVKDSSLDKIIDKKSALKWGVNRIGSKRDTHGVLGFGEGQLFYGATKSIKEGAAKKLVKLFAKKNLTNTIQTKTKSFMGKMISKNIALRPVSYMRAGKEISFIQAVNVKTGKLLSMKVAKMLMGKLK